MNNCLGCAISLGEMKCPGGIIFKTKNFIVNQDYEIPIESFFVIATKKHKKSLIELDENELSELSLLLKKIKQGLLNLFSIEVSYIFQDDNSPHFHIWVFPQLEWMDKIGRGLEKIPEIIEHSHKNPRSETEIVQRTKSLKEYLQKSLPGF